jgi:hypothetical protein
VSDAVASPHHRRVLARLARWSLLRLARAAGSGEPPGPVLAEAAAAGLRESLHRLHRAERDLRLAPVAVALTWRRRQEAIAAFDQTWLRVFSRLRRLYRAVGLEALLAAAAEELPARSPVRAWSRLHLDKNRASSVDAPASPAVGGPESGRSAAAKRGAKAPETTPKGGK